MSAALRYHKDRLNMGQAHRTTTTSTGSTTTTFATREDHNSMNYESEDDDDENSTNSSHQHSLSDDPSYRSNVGPATELNQPSSSSSQAPQYPVGTRVKKVTDSLFLFFSSSL
jgi:hypothetical protein